MKHFWKPVCALLALQLAISHTARADDAATKKALTVKYQVMERALKSKDADAIIQDLTSDFTAKLTGGRTLNRAQFANLQHALLDAITKVRSVTVHIRRATIAASRAVVMVDTNLDVDIKDQQNRTHRYKESSVARDAWVLRSGQWKVRLTEFVSGTTTIDGKKI